MTQALKPVNSIAPLRNVSLLSSQVDRLLNRMEGEPGMGCFFGAPGLGKSFAKVYAANKYRAYHVQADDTWTRKVLCQEILAAMGITPAGTIPEMVKQIAEQLTLSRRPLIIDEADFLVKKSLIEALRAIYERSMTPIILIGEEHLPQNLQRWERVFSRILDWTHAEPASEADARHLANVYCHEITIADDLLKVLHEKAKGSARRIVIGLSSIRKHALTTGTKQMDRANFNGGEFFPGDLRSFR
ncbi:MAG: ATP-binding protein [Nevskiaceae bacterium]|nr:MAG: ATP-binding protein [Nevskiaceae bacterium]